MATKRKRPKKRKPKQARESEKDEPVSLHPMKFTEAISALLHTTKKKS